MGELSQGRAGSGSRSAGWTALTWAGASAANCAFALSSKLKSPPLEGFSRRNIACRRLLLQQLARAKAALKSGQRTTVKPELHFIGNS